MWWVFLGLSGGDFWSVIIALIEPAAIILLAVVLCRVHSAWQRYEKTQVEEKLSRHTLLKGGDMICPNCEFEIEDDMEICPYCHVFVEQPGERAEKQGQPAGQTQDVSASPAVTSGIYYTRKGFLDSPEMARSRKYIHISLGILCLSLFSGCLYWIILFETGARILDAHILPFLLLGSGTATRVVCLRWDFHFSVFATYLYMISMFVRLLIIQRTYNRTCAIIFLMPWALWDLYIGSCFALIEKVAIISLIIQLFKVHNQWQEYEKMQMEKKLVQNTF